MPQTTEQHHAPVSRGIAHAYPFDGVLVVTVELECWPSGYDPVDSCFLFRSPEGWTTLTLRRTEKWDDYGDRPVVGAARVIVKSHPTAADLAQVMQDVNGVTGWRAVLDAARDNDAELRRLWIPVQIERDLDRASFYRPDLVEMVEAGDAASLCRLRADLELELASAGFNVCKVEPPEHRRAAAVTPVIAYAVLRRYGHEFDTVVRMDCAGEVYTRFVDESGPMRDVGDDDE